MPVPDAPVPGPAVILDPIPFEGMVMAIRDQRNLVGRLKADYDLAVQDMNRMEQQFNEYVRGRLNG